MLRKSYEHLDYRPLVNARAHQLGQRRQILNDRFHAQYQRLLRVLSYRPAAGRRGPDGGRRTTCCCRIASQEAADFFGRVNPANLATRLQYDYFAAYLAMSQEQAGPGPGRSRPSTPTIRWIVGAKRSPPSRRSWRRSPAPGQGGRRRRPQPAADPAGGHASRASISRSRPRRSRSTTRTWRRSA